MCAQYFLHIKTVPMLVFAGKSELSRSRSFSCQSDRYQNQLQGKLHATKSSITWGYSADILWRSHAGWAPNSSVNTAWKSQQRKTDCLHTCSFSDIKRRISSEYIFQSLCESLGAVEHRGNWMDPAQSRLIFICLKSVDAENMWVSFQLLEEVLPSNWISECAKRDRW